MSRKIIFLYLVSPLIYKAISSIIKIYQNLYIFRLFNLYNYLLSLNLFFIFFHFFSAYFISLIFFWEPDIVIINI